MLKVDTMINAIFSTLPFGVCLYWSAIFLRKYRTADPAKRLLTRFMLVCTMLYFSHAVYFNRHICRLTDAKPLRLRNYWVLLPALVVSLTSALLYIIMGTERIPFVESCFYKHTLSPGTCQAIAKAQCVRLLLMKIIFAVQLVPVCYFGFKKLTAYNKRVNNFYADTEGKTLTPIRSLLIVFLIMAFLSAIANQIGRDFFIQEPWLVIIVSVIFSSMIFAVAYVGNKQRFTAEDFLRDEERVADEDKLAFATKDAASCDAEVPGAEVPGNLEFLLLGQSICRTIESQQLFRRKGLLITDVARLTGSNRTYISQYLNQELHISFSDFINARRVEYAKSLLTSTAPAYSTFEIIEMSGFTNEVSFYRIFKKHTGTTPKQWSKLNVN